MRRSFSWMFHDPVVQAGSPPAPHPHDATKETADEIHEDKAHHETRGNGIHPGARDNDLSKTQGLDNQDIGEDRHLFQKDPSSSENAAYTPHTINPIRLGVIGRSFNRNP
jgi:hypothetical protein